MRVPSVESDRFETGLKTDVERPTIVVVKGSNRHRRSLSGFIGRAWLAARSAAGRNIQR